MFSRLRALTLTAFTLPLLAAATPYSPEQANGIAKRWAQPTTSATVTTTITVTAPASTVTSVSQCNTGPIQCCDGVESASSAAGTSILGLLGIVLTDVDLLLGLNCSPIQIVGIGNSECNAVPVCCENNSIGGLISIGCVVIIV